MIFHPELSSWRYTPIVTLSIFVATVLFRSTIAVSQFVVHWVVHGWEQQAFAVGEHSPPELLLAPLEHLPVEGDFEVSLVTIGE